MHHTLKKKPLRYEDLAEFVACYNAANRHARKETWSEENPKGRWRRYLKARRDTHHLHLRLRR